MTTYLAPKTRTGKECIVTTTIEREMAAEATAREMGWVPLESEEGLKIWVCMKDIGLDDVPYCDTALEVVRTFAH